MSRKIDVHEFDHHADNIAKLSQNILDKLVDAVKVNEVHEHERAEAFVSMPLSMLKNRLAVPIWHLVDDHK